MAFYSYLWLRDNGTPYYVGKGSNGRAFQRHKRIGSPPPFDRIIVQEFETEEDAFIAECLLISVYGRKQFGGLLCNLTDGGEGPAGAKMTPEWCRKNGERMKGSKVWANRPPDWKEKLRQHFLGKKRPKEVVERHREWMLENNPFRGKKHSEETKLKISLAKLGKKMPNQPEAQRKRHLANPEHLNRIRLLAIESRWGAQNA